jgi:rare lipoprotein A (peptidoglycan hydrolase)
MDASESSLELAARFVPQRASRSARSSVQSAAGSTAATESITTTTAAPSPTTVVVQKAAVAPTSATTRTTVKHRTTTTTRKPKPTTTTAKPAPKTTTAPKPRAYTAPAPAASTGQSEIGQASWYDTVDPVVCAHKTLAMGTVVTVTNVENGNSTTCKVGDRGPFIEGRIVDLSPEAFAALAPLSEGVIDVKLTW